MSVVRTESRCRIGITWYSSPEEADAAASEQERFYRGTGILEKANIGFAQCGRASEHDQPGEYAVITP